MGHLINKTVDRVYLANIEELFEGKGWHGLGIPTEVFDEKLERVFFKYNMHPAMIVNNAGDSIETGERYAVSEDDGLPVGGAVGDRWATPQNLELFEMFKAAIAGSGYTICSVGTLASRAQFFIDAKGKLFKAGNRDISPFFGFHRSFGGIGKLLFKGHNAVMQCGNTTAIFVAETGNGEISTKNTLNVGNRLPAIQRMIEKVHGVHGEFEAAFNEAANTPVEYTSAREAFAGIVVPGNKLTTRSVNRINRLSALFLTGAGNSGENAADLISAVTDFYSHESAGSLDSAESREAFVMKQWASSEYGSGSKIKTEVTNRLLNNSRFDTDALSNYQDIGRAAISRSESDMVAALS